MSRPQPFYNYHTHPSHNTQKKKRSSICEDVCIYNVPGSILVNSINLNKFCVIDSLAGFTVLNKLVDHQPYSPNKTFMLSFLVSSPILNVIRGYEESDQYIHASRVASWAAYAYVGGEGGMRERE